ncbi:MAG: MSMEG_0568 family radical SAM protein [Methanophagales archaeon]|nr:MSMEG_0568 family radical SAM protein [Methanophagales archaeon]
MRLSKETNLKYLKVDLQSNGIRVLKGDKGRIGGAGPAGAKIFTFGDTVANVPTMSTFVENSPYSVELEGGKGILKRYDDEVAVIESPMPEFYKLKTKEGIPYKQIGLLHGTDCLASTPVQTCVYWNMPDRCKFCGIELSRKKGTTTAVKRPEEIAEVADAAKRLDKVSHVTLTIGTLKGADKGIKVLCKCASAIKDLTGLPIHAQFEPPDDFRYLEELHASGVDTVGVHIESFDEDVLRKIAPAKARIGVDGFMNAWKRSVELFGENQVSSFIIAGLGEDDQSIIEGSRILADLGVYPLVLSLRPIPGSDLENEIPPGFERMKRIYEEVSMIVKDRGLSWKRSKAGCVRCRACSALDVFEK